MYLLNQQWYFGYIHIMHCLNDKQKRLYLLCKGDDFTFIFVMGVCLFFKKKMFWPFFFHTFKCTCISAAAQQSHVNMSVSFFFKPGNNRLTNRKGNLKYRLINVQLQCTNVLLTCISHWLYSVQIERYMFLKWSD